MLSGNHSLISLSITNWNKFLSLIEWKKKHEWKLISQNFSCVTSKYGGVNWLTRQNKLADIFSIFLNANTTVKILYLSRCSYKFIIIQMWTFTSDTRYINRDLSNSSQYEKKGMLLQKLYHIIVYSQLFSSFFKRSTFVGFAWSFVFFIPGTTANDLRLRRISIPDFILYIIFLS